jgi:hypothetical protein
MASPILWVSLNQLLLTALGENFDCIRLVSVNGKAEHVRPGNPLFDDTTMGMTHDDTTMDPVLVEVSDLSQSKE